MYLPLVPIMYIPDIQVYRIIKVSVALGLRRLIVS